MKKDVMLVTGTGQLSMAIVRLEDIASGIIVTHLAIDEFNGPRGDFYKNIFAKYPAGRLLAQRMRCQMWRSF